MEWYYAIGGQQNGPVSDDEFNRLVSMGTVQPDTLVWTEGWPEWRAYRTLTSGNAGAGAASSADAEMAVCAVSGKRLPKKDMLEFEGRWVGAEHKEEFFQRLREGVNLPRDVVYASFGRRFAAKFVDGVIVGLINFVLTLLLTAAFAALFSGGAAGATTASAILLQVVVQLSSIGFALCYALFFIRKNDATPGKKMLGLRLVRADGSKLSKGRIVGRHFAEYLSSLTLLIGYLMAAFDKEQRRALHDRVCDTRVLDVRGQ
jgi:uncharacterized RDD family membrane protein YckC